MLTRSPVDGQALPLPLLDAVQDTRQIHTSLYGRLRRWVDRHRQELIDNGGMPLNALAAVAFLSARVAAVSDSPVGCERSA